MEVCNPSLPTPMQRPGFGRAGKPIVLLTNYCKAPMAKIELSGHFYQYDVSLSEDGRPVEGRRGGDLGRRIVERAAETYGEELGGRPLAYDGERCLFTVGSLPNKNLSFTVALPGATNRIHWTCRPDGTDLTGENHYKKQKCSYQSKIFKIDIRFAAKIPVSALENYDPKKSREALRVLDIILKQCSAKKYSLNYHQFFFANDAKNFIELGGALIGCTGIYSSFRMTQSGLYLNTDVSTTVIVKPGSILDFLMANQNVRTPNMICWRRAKHVLKNLKVTISHLHKERKIIGFSERPCKQQSFQLKIRSMMDSNSDTGVSTVDVTVHDYFVKYRHIELHYSADLPCINVGRGHPEYYPLELCYLVPMQRYTKALSSCQRSTLLEGSTQKPREKLMVLAHELRSNKYDADPMLLACGISPNYNFMKLKGRVLSAPKLKLGNGKETSPHNGTWSVSNEKLYNPVEIKCWAAVNFSTRCDLNDLCQEIIKCGAQKGIHVGPPQKLCEENPQWRSCQPMARVQQMFRQLEPVFPDKPPEFILCVLSSGKNDGIYGAWKRKCLSDCGIVTQCVASTKINNQYLNSLLLKINAKLGGLNFQLNVQRPAISLVSKIPTIILGMDVYHGPAGRSDMPSIAAVVGSRKWPSISHYRASMRVQLPRIEIIDSLFQPQTKSEDKGMIWELLKEFYESSGGREPEQIIIFRDGVSESEFYQVLNIELNQVIKACKLHYSRQLPKITLIVAQKRHRTKFFLDGSSDNVPPGTVVDSGVCHPKHNDFFICPHLGLLGTSRPRHYHILLDQIGFSSDDLQELVHSLSYIFQRSTSAISDVAPVRYAHLAAGQMSQMINLDGGLGSDENSSGTTFTVPELPKLHRNVCNSMFFC